MGTNFSRNKITLTSNIFPVTESNFLKRLDGLRGIRGGRLAWLRNQSNTSTSNSKNKVHNKCYIMSSYRSGKHHPCTDCDSNFIKRSRNIRTKVGRYWNGQFD